MDAQLLIIGGGIAGLSLAWRLAPSMSVVVVEAEDSLGFHSSSRSARQMQPSYGPAPVRELTLRTIAMVTEVSASLPSPILKPRPLVTLGSVAEVNALAADKPFLVLLDHQETLDLSPEVRPEAFEAAVVDNTAMEVDVPALLEYYRSEAVAAGAVVLTAAPVRSATARDRGFEVVAGEHRITAAAVVNAAGAWADPVAVIFGVRPRGLVAHRRSVAIVSTAKPVNPAGPMVEPANGTFYYRPDGEQLLISPSESVPAEPGNAQVIEADIAELIHRIDAVTSLGITGVERSWTGLRTHPADGLPVVGFDAEVPAFFWLAGQGGYGIQTSAALASLAAGLLRGKLLGTGLLGGDPGARDAELAARDAELAVALSPQRAGLE